jgi:anti-sigma B factor antagonist
LGELLVRKQSVAPEAIDHALALQREQLLQGRRAPRLGDLLIERKFLDRDTLRELLEEQKIGRGEKKILRITLREVEGVVVLGLEGRLDQVTEPSLTRIFERLMNKGITQVAIDGSRLVFLNSRGASSFVTYIDESRARGGDVKFFALRSEPRFTLDRLGLHRFLQLFPTEGEAVTAFQYPIDEYMSRGSLGEYISAPSTRYYHLSYCTSAQTLPEEARLYYQSKWHARDSGKLPCRRCKP